MHDWIIIPTYNERRNIAALIPKIFGAVAEAHVMVVDDASPDGTQNAVFELGKRYPNLELYPHDQKAGFAKAYTDAFDRLLRRDGAVRSVTMMDADFSHDPAYLPVFLKLIRNHDLVIGSRYVSGGGVTGWEWWRRALSFGGNLYLRGISRLLIRDITGGFTCIRAELLRSVPYAEPPARGYAFQYVLKSHLLEKAADVIEVPILFRNRLEGESKLTNHIIGEALLMPWKMKTLRRR